MEKQKVQSKNDARQLAFGKENYIIMLVGIVFIVLGFVLMTGGGSDDPAVFTGDQLFNSTRLTVAPVLVMVGFAIEVIAIVYKSKE